jgi:hypothetical protein
VRKRERGTMHACMTYESIVDASSKQRLLSRVFPFPCEFPLSQSLFSVGDAVTIITVRCSPCSCSFRRCRLIRRREDKIISGALWQRIGRRKADGELMKKNYVEYGFNKAASESPALACRWPQSD